MGSISGIKLMKMMLLMMALMMAMPLVSAIGLTSPAWGDHIGMYKGESMVVTFMLQNMVGGKDIKARVTLLEGEEIAKLIDGKEIYNLPYGRKDIPINIRLSIPKENAQDEYMVRFNVVTISTDKSRPVELATGLEKRFTVGIEKGERSPTGAAQIQTEPVPSPVIEKPGILSKEDTRTVIIAVVLVIIIVILYRAVKKHRKKHEQRGNYEL